MQGCEKGWDGRPSAPVSVEREKGFEPSTSTLARWERDSGAHANRAIQLRVRVSAGLFRPLIGHRGVGRGVGA